jgi:NADPH-dependent F420 reductase
MSKAAVAILGGTGPLGRGLAVRFALAGHQCVIGSRNSERAEEAATELRDILSEQGQAGQHAQDVHHGQVSGMTNAEAVRACDLVIVAVPYDAVEPTLSALVEDIADKIVVSCVNALRFGKQGPLPQRVEAGSAAQECQLLLPGARVVGAYHHLSAVLLLEAATPLDCDVLITGDDPEAASVVAELTESLDGARPVLAGGLALTQPVEDLTAVLIAVNKRYQAHAGVKITDLNRT